MNSKEDECGDTVRGNGYIFNFNLNMVGDRENSNEERSRVGKRINILEERQQGTVRRKG